MRAEVTHGREPEVAEQSPELRLGAREIDVVAAESTLARGLDARLLRVELPWVNVHQRGLSLGAIHASHAPLHVEVRQEAQVPAAAEGEVAAEQGRRRDGELHQLLPVALPDHVRKACGVGQTVERIANGKHTRVVAQTEVEEDVRCPERFGREGERRRTVSEHGRSRDVLEGLLRALDVGAELVGRLLVDDPMRVAVRCDLVSVVDDPPDEVGVALGIPRQDEERSGDADLVAQCEDAIGIALHA